MMKLTTFDKTALCNIRTDLQAAIAQVEAKYGIKLTAGKAKYSDKSASIQIDMSTFDSTGKVIDREREALLANLSWLGLKPEHLDQSIRIGNDSFKITGYKRARHSKPFSIVSMTNGMSYVTSDDAVRTALNLPRRIGRTLKSLV